MKKNFGTEPKIGYCPLSMRLGAGAQAWAGVARSGCVGGRELSVGARVASERQGARRARRAGVQARGARSAQVGKRQARRAGRSAGRGRARQQARAHAAWAWLGTRRAAWARGLVAGCVLGALGPFSIRFDSVFSRVKFFRLCL